MPDQNSPNGVPGFTPSAPPPVGGAATTELGGLPTSYKPPTHIGVGLPGIFNVPYAGGVQTQFGTPAQATAYLAGDQFAPASLPPQDVVALKEQMLQAGLLTTKTVGNLAVWDSNAASAYGKVLGFANIYGMNATDALTYYQNNPSTVTGSSGAAPSAVGLTSPTDINQTFQNEAQQLTGQQQQAPSGFTDQYHAQEAAAQHPRGATYTAPPTVANAADQYLQTQDPSQVQAYGAASRMQDFFSLLGSAGVK